MGFSKKLHLGSIPSTPSNKLKMKIRFINYRKEFKGKYPLTDYKIRFKSFWSGKIKDITWRGYAISFDFRTGSFVDWMLTSKEKQLFLERWFMKRN
jgi:hypothetical protein